MGTAGPHPPPPSPAPLGQSSSRGAPGWVWGPELQHWGDVGCHTWVASQHPEPYKGGQAPKGAPAPRSSRGGRSPTAPVGGGRPKPQPSSAVCSSLLRGAEEVAAPGGGGDEGSEETGPYTHIHPHTPPLHTHTPPGQPRLLRTPGGGAAVGWVRETEARSSPAGWGWVGGIGGDRSLSQWGCLRVSPRRRCGLHG